MNKAVGSGSTRALPLLSSWLSANAAHLTRERRICQVRVHDSAQSAARVNKPQKARVNTDTKRNLTQSRREMKTFDCRIRNSSEEPNLRNDYHGQTYRTE